jgi:Uma2 family endonuclease
MLDFMQTEVPRKRFSVDEYLRMVETGILGKNDHVELLEGEILEMSPIGKRHQACVDRANQLFHRLLQDKVIVRAQGSIRLGDYNRPQPDLVLLKFQKDFYASTEASQKDALLVIEVSDSSLPFDRGPKLAVYAKHGVREVWIEDLTTDTLLVFRDRSPLGYATSRALKRGDIVSPLSFPDLSIAVADLLGSGTSAEH